jgi:DNA-binding domain
MLKKVLKQDSTYNSII